ncbi:MAG: M17 family metallopeptidase [Planctomycetota bacterium]
MQEAAALAGWPWRATWATPRATWGPPPPSPAQRAAGREAGFKVKILLPADMQRLGMGALLGVAKGSAEPPRFIHMEYSPKDARGGTVCLVGKGLTFDSGGISIKPSEGMEEMKFDKCGGCAVIGALKAVARAKLPVRVVGLVPSTENMPGAAANKPGDVLTALNGKTIEVLNTDAEGRLILADALAYSARVDPEVLIDFATLTMGVIVSLGKVRAGLMTPDPRLERELRVAGDASGELVWPLPMDDAYGEHVKGTVADVKNMGRGREAVAIAGGWFLRNFVPEGPRWAHVDIAGTAWHTKDPGLGYTGVGASGYGVRLSFAFLKAYAAQQERA